MIPPAGSILTRSAQPRGKDKTPIGGTDTALCLTGLRPPDVPPQAGTGQSPVTVLGKPNARAPSPGGFSQPGVHEQVLLENSVVTSPLSRYKVPGESKHGWDAERTSGRAFALPAVLRGAGAKAWERRGRKLVLQMLIEHLCMPGTVCMPTAAPMTGRPLRRAPRPRAPE